jgi:hypothetical protein
MAAPRKTQKQLSEKYKDNLDHYSRKQRLRRAVILTSILAVVATFAAIKLFYNRQRQNFFNPGPISSQHASFGNDCERCHDKSAASPGQLTFAKLRGTLNQRFHSGVAFDSIDRKCQTCHIAHTLHEPNVVQDRSCSACHQEHRGLSGMKTVADLNCASCHNNPPAMNAAAEKGLQLQWQNFRRHPLVGAQVALELPRPQRGFTQTFAAFDNGHPEFQLQRDKAKDPDILRFNHRRHFGPDVPAVNGKKLDCNYCHKPAGDGRYFQRISFAANCQACHSLQFDPKNPELTLPHGNATAVRGFLRTLETQYADLAVRKGMTQPNQIRTFVGKQMAQIRDRVRSGEDFERQVFFTVDPYKSLGSPPDRSRAAFAGCAFCHEVKPVANAAPEITKPVLIDRWMVRARFDHTKHASISCNDCHHASESTETSDVLIPVKANCVSCHNQKAPALNKCMLCHSYHAKGVTSVALGGVSRSSLREMLQPEHGSRTEELVSSH